tara:strand:+ start:146 stop:367 length:222 start_codon:yes stop_codon:yes gene_type:complete
MESFKVAQCPEKLAHKLAIQDFENAVNGMLAEEILDAILPTDIEGIKMLTEKITNSRKTMNSRRRIQKGIFLK